MVNDFCFLLSNGLYITDKEDNNLVFKPCCIFEEKSFSYNVNNWNIIKDWTNSCSRCLLKENNNKNSRRQEMNNWFNNVKSETLTHLEIDHNNACNAACGMCNSMSSSSIARILRSEGANNVNVPNVKQKTIFEIIYQLDLDNIKVIKFRGGEPFYSNFHQKVIEKVKFPDDATLMYQTNGSIYPSDRWWKTAKKFKEIHLSFSIDAVQDKFNYIRTNLNFEQVKKNMIKILKNNEINLQTSIQCTVNPLNAYYFDELFDFFQELKKINKNITFNWHDCWGDWGLENTPIKLRELIAKKYKKLNLSNFIKDLNYNDDNFIKFVLSLQKHEKRFNLDGYKVFPEIYPIIMDHYKTLI